MTRTGIRKLLALMVVAGLAGLGAWLADIKAASALFAKLTAPTPSSASRLSFGPPDGETQSVNDVALPAGATVFDSQYPGIANLDPSLLRALRQAATDAMDDDVTFHVTSGWRTPAYQDQLLAQAIATHGSRAEAARWVAPPEKSLHVSGQAVDMENAAAEWLAQHGPSYGLCQVYNNEPWHYELRPDAPTDGCPLRYADPTQDPRLA